MMIKLSNCTKEEMRVFWLKNAQSWFAASEFWLEHDDPIDALRCFVRAMNRIVWAFER